MFPIDAPQDADPRAALIQALSQPGGMGGGMPSGGSQSPVEAAMARAHAVGSIHQIAAALAAQVARQKAPLGKARVPRPTDGGYNGNWAIPGVSRVGFAGNHHSMVDGGYDWSRRAFPPHNGYGG